MGTALTAAFRTGSFRWRWLVVVGIISIIASLSAVAPAAAAGAISQAYKTSSNNISKGALLSVVASDATKVEPANNNNAAKLVGVAADKPLVELSGDAATEARVVVGGTTEVLVSDVNGTVNTGDKITVSPVSGIGMKAVGSSEIVGTAQASLSTVTTVSQSVAKTNGQNQTIKVGLIPVAINVTYYSASMSQGAISSFVPPFLQSLANSITGRQVSPVRVLIGATAMLLGFIAVMIILYTSIRNGLISIGRNPLAQKALRRGLVDVIFAAIGLLLITAAIVYATLIL